MSDDKPIIVIKKKGGHGGHHGGAWKVAYADFVTAMMAFFMVMWLLNSADVTTKQNIASYFKRPGIFHEGSGTPLMIGESGILEDAYVPPHPEDSMLRSGKSQDPLLRKSGISDDEDPTKRVSPTGLEGSGVTHGPQKSQGHLKRETDMKYSGLTEPTKKSPSREKKPINLEAFQHPAAQKMTSKIKREIDAIPELQEILGIVDVKLQADGLNIEIMDTEKTSMFKSGSADIQPQAKLAFGKLAGILKDVPNTIEIIGHTDAIPFLSNRDGKTNWELSADRANTARRLLQTEGIEANRIVGVVGKADRQLKRKGNPFAASNRRITLKMRFNEDMTIDLSKNPDGLKDINVEDFTAPEPVEEVHDFTPEEVLQPKKRKNSVPLPPLSETPPAERPTGGDPIFDKNPALGPRDPFAGF